MKRRRTEFLAIPITLVGLGLLFLISCGRPTPASSHS